MDWYWHWCKKEILISFLLLFMLSQEGDAFHNPKNPLAFSDKKAVSLADTTIVKKIQMEYTQATLLQLSENLLYQVKTKKATQALEKELANLSFNDLIDYLPDDNAKKTFWINIYNAYYQLLYSREGKRKPKIFTGKFVYLAKIRFSLDDIEHGILRRYCWKYSLGYLQNFFAPAYLKELAVETIDFRIHFALNCGAKSCPPIAFYQYEQMETQLDQATRSFLTSETTIDESQKTITTSKILAWYRGDFGGKKGIKKEVGKLVGKDLSNYKVRFYKYDWEAQMENFAE